jgi:AcrR family transcriptional regulator
VPGPKTPPKAAKAQAGADSSSVLRRRPRQARSQERINRILDTAENVFAEVGYEAATTNLIASQAATSIGSLYEFFPNKDAIGRALAERYIEQIDRLYENLFETAFLGADDSAGHVNGQVVVERIVHGLDEFYRAHPGAVPLLNGQHTSPDLAAAGARLQIALERRIEAVLAQRRPELPVASWRLIAMVIADVARALLVRADSVPLSQRRAIVRELDRVVVGYLRMVSDEESHGRSQS